MKLDKIRFAQLVSHIQYWIERRDVLMEADIDDLDLIIDIQVPATGSAKADPGEVENLMRFMADGKLKIEAIKSFRTLTGQGLKESKDAVERYWIGNRNEGANLGDILNMETKNN